MGGGKVYQTSRSSWLIIHVYSMFRTVCSRFATAQISSQRHQDRSWEWIHAGCASVQIESFSWLRYFVEPCLLYLLRYLFACIFRIIIIIIFKAPELAVTPAESFKLLFSCIISSELQRTFRQVWSKIYRIFKFVKALAQGIRVAPRDGLKNPLSWWSSAPGPWWIFYIKEHPIISYLQDVHLIHMHTPESWSFGWKKKVSSFPYGDEKKTP